MSSMFNAPHFQSVEAARKYLEALRWGAERVCPHCGTLESFATKKPGVYRCRSKECRKDFSVTTKSVMESSHIKLNIWLQAFYLMSSSKKGVSSHQLHRALGITYKSAWFLTHRIREAMRAGGLLPPMGSGGKTGIYEMPLPAGLTPTQNAQTTTAVLSRVLLHSISTSAGIQIDDHGLFSLRHCLPIIWPNSALNIATPPPIVHNHTSYSALSNDFARRMGMPFFSYN